MTHLLEESGKKFEGQYLYAFFGQYRKREIEDENVELFVQRLKMLILCDLLTWTRLFISDNSMSIIVFIDWLGLV